MNSASVSIESVLAAVIENNDGLVVIPAALLKKQRPGLAIAINYDDEKDAVHFTLVESDDIDYDDDV